MRIVSYLIPNFYGKSDHPTLKIIGGRVDLKNISQGVKGEKY